MTSEWRQITVQGYLEERLDDLSYPRNSMLTSHPIISANLLVSRENWPYSNSFDDDIILIPLVIDTGWMCASSFDYFYEITCFTDGNNLYYGGTENGHYCLCKPIHHYFGKV